MNLYDEIIKKTNALLASLETKRLVFKDAKWPDAGSAQLIFKDDTAFELGGGALPGLSGTLLSSDESLKGDEAYLIGPSLNKIKSDSPYARIALIKVKDEEMGRDNALYQNIRKVDYVRYHVNPEGFMMRISSLSKKESVRVSRLSLKKGLSFEDAASLFIQGYHAIPFVESVHLYFITDPRFDYEALSKLLTSSEDVTMALDHLLNKVKMDCHSCSLQKVCSEVEAKVKEDFGQDSSAE